MSMQEMTAVITRFQATLAAALPKIIAATLPGDAARPPAADHDAAARHPRRRVPARRGRRGRTAAGRRLQGRALAGQVVAGPVRLRDRPEGLSYTRLTGRN